LHSFFSLSFLCLHQVAVALLLKVSSVQVSDTRNDEYSNTVGNIIIFKK